METDWHIHLELAGELTERQVDDLLETLRPYSGVVSGGAPGFPTHAATFTVSAPSAPAAAAKALEIFETAAPRRPFKVTDVQALEVVRQADVERAIERPTFPELVGTTEAARLLGLTKQRIWALARETNADFPVPVIRLAAGPIWLRSSILAFAARPRATGQPRKEQCHVCGTGVRIEMRAVDHTLQTSVGAVLVVHVPARVCARCGAETFTPDVVRRLEDIRRVVEGGILQTFEASLRRVDYQVEIGDDMQRTVERELPWSLHRSPGWRGQLQRVRRWHQRLRVVHSLEDAEDFLYAFFQNCYHLRDWLQPPEFDRAQVETLFREHIEFQICRDVCNMTKHLELSRPPATGREPSIAREYAGRGHGWVQDWNLMILSQGRQYDALGMASKCLELWEMFLANAEKKRPPARPISQSPRKVLPDRRPFKHKPPVRSPRGPTKRRKLAR